ncbi:MAG: glycosyltransferase family 2 protein [Candidatus Marinimicrobia bacterium]|nr:glycosyltransferase family 2 protein [Candidatus Neomarinimicrobiota bacterium]
MNKPKLTIAMIVKNEESNLQRCLDSFLPIIMMKDDETLESLTELIIVDTGSTDRTVNIAKKFTDKVYIKEFIPWDFSKARNYGIKKATGDKIMIIDADEELRQESVYRLEDIILNPKYKEPSIFINIYNYYSRDLKQYSEMLQPRIFVNDKDFHYEHTVHNKPILKTPYLFAPRVILNHYGYVFQGEKGEKLLGNKMERSLPMLEKEYKKHPENLHNLTHLVKTYYVIHDFKNTIKYGEMWIKQMRKAKYNEGWNAFLEGFVNLVGSYLALDDIENAEKMEREACHYSSRISQLYLMLGNYYTGRDNEKAKENFEIAVDIFKTEGSLYEKLLINNTRIVLPEILNWLAIHYFEKKDYAKAGKYMNEGIQLNKGRLPLKWSIWEATKEAKKNLISIES